MRIMFRTFVVCLAAVMFSMAAPAQSGSIVQDEHDKRVKADSERNTKYHNNADDYPKVDTSGDAALAKKIADSFRTVKLPAPSLNYVPTAEDGRFDALRARYLRGDKTSYFDFGMMRYTSKSWAIHDASQAQEMFLKIANENPAARFLAGYIMYNGEAGPADMDRGMSLIRSAADSGDVSARDYLKSHPVLKPTVGEFGSMTTRALGEIGHPYVSTPKEFKLVEERSKKAAGLYTAVGRAYMYGLGVPVDLKKARETLSIQPGLFEEDFIWLDFLEGKPSEQAFIKAVAAFAEKYDWPSVRYLQALSASVQHHSEEQRYFLLEAVRYLRGGSGQATPGTYLELAVMQLTGEGGPVDNEWGMIDLMYAQSNANAQYILSQILTKGSHGVAKDEAKARSLLEAAAKAGQQDAIRQLAGK